LTCRDTSVRLARLYVEVRAEDRAPPVALRAQSMSIAGRRAYTKMMMEVTMRSPLLTRDPEIMSGALCFAGTRVPVKHLFDYLEGSSSLEEFLADFPTVSRERAIAVLETARERLAADAPVA
jgi:uncharacterized protein (DUF433 family)